MAVLKRSGEKRWRRAVSKSASVGDVHLFDGLRLFDGFAVSSLTP